MIAASDTRNDGATTAVRAHYDDLLGPIYGWMVGGFDLAIAAARAELWAVGVAQGAGGTAADLGAGLGAHTVALAEAGYAVTAIDTCEALLDDLRARARHRAVTLVRDDLVHLRRHCPSPLDVILCMGDTLTHLSSVEAVEHLFDDVAVTLAPGGVFVATFRDYTGAGLTGARRVIPVRQDADRTLTCVLEFTDTTVIVHDVVRKRAAGHWAPHASRYQKLRLDPAWARAALGQRALSARLEPGLNGMVRLVAVRPT